eukprot:1777044-Alexandrium_andersonii.AAC.1
MAASGLVRTQYWVLCYSGFRRVARAPKERTHYLVPSAVQEDCGPDLEREPGKDQSVDARGVSFGLEGSRGSAWATAPASDCAGSRLRSRIACLRVGLPRPELVRGES